jgi:hypothetical protein
VLAICIAPLVDLPATKLGSDNVVLLLLCTFMAVATISFIKAFNQAASPTRIWLVSPTQKRRHYLAPLDINSILRR